MKKLTGHRKLIEESAVQLLLNYCQLSNRNFRDISKDFRYISDISKFLFIYCTISRENPPKTFCEALGCTVMWLVCPSCIFIQRCNRVQFHYVFLTSQQRKMAGVVVPYRFLQKPWQPG